jgi:hypothetical protein
VCVGLLTLLGDVLHAAGGGSGLLLAVGALQVHVQCRTAHALPCTVQGLIPHLVLSFFLLCLWGQEVWEAWEHGQNERRGGDKKRQ